MVVPLLVIAIILIVAVGGGAGYYLYQSGYLKSQENLQQKQQEQKGITQNQTSGQQPAPVPAIPLAYP